MRKLEIGSGNRPLPGYEHLDIDPNLPDLDFVCSMDSIPVEDNTFDEIMSVHTIEHIGWRQGLTTLREWYRIMKPGAKVTVACPNLRFICKAYLENGKTWREDFDKLNPDERKHLKVSGYHSHSLWANFKIFSSGANGDEHMACYDSDLLGALLSDAGFKKIRTLHDGDSLIMEAIK